MKPSSALIIVLLPAPFGPSSPTAPAANDEVTSRSASWRPYETLTVSSVTTGSDSGITYVIRFPTASGFAREFHDRKSSNSLKQTSRSNAEAAKDAKKDS